jgi:Holliday junction resolvase RusA-like endonuclease
MEMRTFKEFSIHCRPIPLNGYKTVWKGKKRISAAGHKYRDEAKRQLEKIIDFKPISSPCILFLTIFLRDKRAGDVDNYLKCILDSFSKIVYDDDKLVQTVIPTKVTNCGFDSIKAGVVELKEGFRKKLERITQGQRKLIEYF